MASNLSYMLGLYGIISDFPEGNQRNVGGGTSRAYSIGETMTKSMARCGDYRMLLIQFQEYSVKTWSFPVHSRCTDEIEGTHVYACVYICVLRPGFHKLDYTRWNVRARRCIRLLERNERPFRAILLALFRFTRWFSLSLHPHFILSLLLSFSSFLFRNLASFAETGYGDWRIRESRFPLSIPRVQTRSILTWNSSHVSDPRIKHFAREIKRDPRRLVNTRTG